MSGISMTGLAVLTGSGAAVAIGALAGQRAAGDLPAATTPDHIYKRALFDGMGLVSAIGVGTAGAGLAAMGFRSGGAAGLVLLAGSVGAALGAYELGEATLTGARS